jgi:molybdenum storage protein
LLDSNYEDLPIEWELLRTLESAQKVTSFRVINGLVRGNLRKALAGEDIGTLVYASRHPQ